MEESKTREDEFGCVLGEWEEQKDIVEIVKKLCEMKGVRLIEGKSMCGLIHMYLMIPSKMSVSEFMPYLKGKSAFMFYDRNLEMQKK